MSTWAETFQMISPKLPGECNHLTLRTLATTMVPRIAYLENLICVFFPLLYHVNRANGTEIRPSPVRP